MKTIPITAAWRTVRIDTGKTPYGAAPGRPGVAVMPLCEDRREAVFMERWQAGGEVTLEAEYGLECLVIDGTFSEGGELFERHSWLRLPKGYRTTAKAGADGATLWVKRGHLAEPPTAPGA